MKVYVIGSNGRGLMPTTPRKARILLRDKKAQCIRKVPFTIRLLYKTGSATQHVELGIDTGSQHIGVAVVSEDKVLTAEECAMRTTMDKRRLLAQRREYRRGRRYRKTPYRKPKFKSRTIRRYSEKPDRRNKRMTHWIKTSVDYSFGRDAGWLPPSMQSKVDMEIRIIAYQSRLDKIKKTCKAETRG